ncbi:MAG: DUF2141 domain-containing protein [Acidobacteriaceae bacterium]
MGFSGFALVALLVPLVASAQRDPSGHYVDAVPGKPLCMLRIHVTGFRNDKGKAGGVIFASPAGWPEDRSKAVADGGFDIHNRQATEEFKVPPGRYGVAVIHDENANQKLDRNFLGIPKEGFGFANNPRVLLSAPSFQAASTQVGCPVTEIQIRLIYK